ncbi:hypothetical protein FGO68_gene10224 [Halteria grandinella]|uniref:Uncharacterized protein n=1 Tax=Halteria grandinella TaxID=5974 RepID=A0A8J8NKA3_HALGN|nr:hypothetical protein FGO68_gene10224 [Halteria grandinella]
MEYLPEKKRTQKAQVLKKEEKIRQFREYLANNDVVLSIVKYLLTVRGKDPLPQDPLVHLRDYFGEERSPMWDVVDQLKEENIQIQEELPAMQRSIEELQKELKAVKLQNRALLIYQNLIDSERTNAVGYKSIVLKLSGFAKFELDTKITRDQFHQLVEGMCRRPINSGHEASTDSVSQTELDEDKYEQICSLFERAYKEAQPPFAGDLENEVYKSILNRIRTYQPSV